MKKTAHINVSVRNAGFFVQAHYNPNSKNTFLLFLPGIMILSIILLLLSLLSGGGKTLLSKTVRIETAAGNMKARILQPKKADGPAPGVLWIHGGGYMLGGSFMLDMSCGKMLAEKCGAVVVCPNYRLAGKAPYPAALDDCYAALEWMYRNADTLGIDRSRIVVGGESAGGGIAAAVCLYARDKGDIPVAMQLPLYPMLDCEDTESSADNHGRVWNTKRNHWGWKHYLGEMYGTDSVSKYASPARETDYSDLPPCYTFVADGEPFYAETLTYVKNLQAAGVDAKVDVYPGNTHAFDMLLPRKETSKAARQRVLEEFERHMAIPSCDRKCQNISGRQISGKAKP